MNSKCYRDKEIYHPIGPHDLHYCRYWMDMAASQVSTKFLDFLFHVASQINSLQLTLTQRFVLLAVGLLKTGMRRRKSIFWNFFIHADNQICNDLFALLLILINL